MDDIVSNPHVIISAHGRFNILTWRHIIILLYITFKINHVGAPSEKEPALAGSLHYTAASRQTVWRRYRPIARLAMLRVGPLRTPSTLGKCWSRKVSIFWALARRMSWALASTSFSKVLPSAVLNRVMASAMCFLSFFW